MINKILVSLGVIIKINHIWMGLCISLLSQSDHYIFQNTRIGLKLDLSTLCQCSQIRSNRFKKTHTYTQNIHFFIENKGEKERIT
jgi:hypothetical protein